MNIEKRVTKRGVSYRGRVAGETLQAPKRKDVADWVAETRIKSKLPDQPTRGELYRQWQDYITVNRSKAYSESQRRVHKRVTSHFDGWPWFEVTKSAVLSYLDSLPLTHRSRNEAIGNLTTPFNHFVRRDILPYNPLDKIERYGHESARPYVPPVADMNKLLDCASTEHPERVLVMDVALETGCRIGEIVYTGLRPSDKWLRWEDCELSTEEPVIRLWTAKSGKSTWLEAWMPISKELAVRLKEWKLRGVGDGEHVFPWTYTALKRWLKQCCIKARIKPFGWHSFRHFFAHYLAMHDIPDKQIQLGLRHKSVAMTQRYLQSLKPSHDLVKHTFKRDLSLEASKRAKGGIS